MVSMIEIKGFPKFEFNQGSTKAIYIASRPFNFINIPDTLSTTS